MLEELPTTQPEPSLRRRWFADEDVDLVVWEDGEGISSFRLCYDKGADEHAWTWTRDGRSIHERVDSGEDDPFFNRTPVLCPDGEMPTSRIRTLIRDRGAELPAEIRELVERQASRL